MTTSHNGLILDHFTVADPGGLTEKLGHFKAGGPNRIGYLLDFDRTLTTSPLTGEDLTTWALLDNLLPGEVRRAHAPVSQHYQNLEFEGRLSETDAHNWWTRGLKLYEKHSIRMDAICSALGQLTIRAGAQELFALCETANMPTTILSAGIGDVIELIAKKHGIKPTAIISNKLRFENGQVAGWESDSLTHVLNKHAKGHDKLSAMRDERPLTVLIGDSIEDARMVQGTDNVLRIRVGDRRPDFMAGWEQYVQASFAAGFDMVTNNEDLLPIVALTEWLIDRK